MKSSEFILTESQILEESIKAKVAKLAAAGIISLGVGIAIPRIMDAYQHYEKVEQILLTDLKSSDMQEYNKYIHAKDEAEALTYPSVVLKYNPALKMNTTTVRLTQDPTKVAEFDSLRDSLIKKYHIED